MRKNNFLKNNSIKSDKSKDLKIKAPSSKQNNYKKIFFLLFLFNLNIYFHILKKEKEIKIEKEKENEKETIVTEYIKEQNEFCSNLSKFYDRSIEDKLIIIDIKLNEIEFKMYAPYKNVKSHPYEKEHCFEKEESLNIMAALKYYSQKNHTIDNKNIFMLDIGGNIGWYPSLLGRFGYTILTFEPNYDNYYINRKNYCKINRNSNVIIIPKGLNNEEKKM